jgi:hypothetical protein
VLKLDTWTVQVQRPRFQEQESISYGERLELDALWARAKGANPATTLYARFLGEGAAATAEFERLLSMVVRTNVEGDVAEGIERILVASRHAYVFLTSADVGDRLFQRLRDGDPALEQKVFICRRKDYLPAPGLLSKEQIMEDRAAEKGTIGLAENEERRSEVHRDSNGMGYFEGSESAVGAMGGANSREAGPVTSAGAEEALRADSRRRAVWIGDLPADLDPFVSSSAEKICSACDGAMSGFDVLPSDASRIIHSIVRTGGDGMYAFAEMSSVMGADLLIDANYRGRIPLQVNGTGSLMRVPRKQRWTVEAGVPSLEEQREQNALWQEVETLNPARVVYARSLRGEIVPRKREHALRDEVLRLGGIDGEGIEKVVCASKHAYVAFRSEETADEFFARARERALEARFCFVRHKEYLPGPGMFVNFYAPESYLFYRKPATIASYMSPTRRALFDEGAGSEQQEREAERMLLSSHESPR